MDWFLYDIGLRHERVKLWNTEKTVLLVVYETKGIRDLYFFKNKIDLLPPPLNRNTAKQIIIYTSIQVSRCAKLSSSIKWK